MLSSEIIDPLGVYSIAYYFFSTTIGYELLSFSRNTGGRAFALYSTFLTFLTFFISVGGGAGLSSMRLSTVRSFLEVWAGGSLSSSAIGDYSFVYFFLQQQW